MTEERKVFSPASRITLRTMRNGYSLDVDDEGYMYYDIDDLMEGFYMHVGLGRPNDMTKDQMADMLQSIKDGTAVVQIQREAANYQREIRNLKIKVHKLEMKLKKYEW